MKILQEVDKPGSDVDAYVNALDEILLMKASSIINLREKLHQFKNHLKQEEVLARELEKASMPRNASESMEVEA